MNARAIGASASVLLHVALVLAFVWTAPEPTKETTAEPKKAEKNDEMEMRLIPASEGGDGLACDGSYRGIGVVTNWGGNVEEVVSGGPADRAGMHIGDVFLNAEMFSRDLYSVGRDLVLKVDRHGVRLDLPVRIGRICFEQPRGAPHPKDHP